MIKKGLGSRPGPFLLMCTFGYGVCYHLTNMFSRYWVAFLIVLVCASSGVSQEFGSGVQITTEKAPWLLRILGHDLDLAGADAKPDQQSAYFIFKSDMLTVSTFIEPVDKCKTADECRDMVLKAGNPKWGRFQDLAMGKLGEASYFEFYRPEVEGRPLKMFDVYAQFVVDGYWVDMHISKPVYTTKDHVLFENVVKDTKFIPKSQKGTSAFDSMLSAGMAAAGDWLALWDQAKCGENFLAMSAMSRAENKEDSWTDYCTKINGAVGPLKSRQPIAAAFTGSIPGKTDRPLALLAYHSVFTKRPSVVEIVGLMLEKDNRWRATNYVPR